MRKLVCLILAGVIALSCGAVPGFATADIAVKVDGTAVSFPDAKPYINSDSRTLVPVRFVAEALGAKVDWVNDSQTVVITKDSDTITLKIGENRAFVNGTEKTFDTKAVINADRTFVPLRFVSEALKKKVFWEGDVSTVNISTVADDDFFNRDDIRKYTSKQKFDIKDGKLLFKDSTVNPPYENYELKETLNPDINRQVYELTKALLDKDHFVNTMYVQEYNQNGLFTPSYAYVQYAKNEKLCINNYNSFAFTFYESAPYNAKKDANYDGFSSKVVISFNLGSLWDDFDPNSWTTPSYENRLKLAFIALFGDKNGIDIYNYVVGEYINKRKVGWEKYLDIKETKYFGNVQVDFGNSQGSPLYFFFSYVNS